MGFLKNILGGSSEPKAKKSLPWKPLTDLSQLNEIEALSKGKTQLSLNILQDVELVKWS